VIRAVWPWARLLGGLGIIALVLWRLGTGAFLDGLRVINGGTLLAGLGIGLLTTVFSAWRWCLVSRGLGIRLPLRSAVADYYRALFLNAALPSGVVGDVHRAVRHGRDVGDVGRGLRAVVLERSAGQIVFVAVGVTVLLAYPSPVLAHVRFVATPVTVTALVVAGALAVTVVAGIQLRRVSSRWARALRTGVSDIRRGLLARENWPGILISSAVVLAGHLATFLVAARAAGSSAPVTRLVPLMVLAMLAMLLPLNIGGWGPREGACAWAFGAAGLGAAQGVTIGVVYGLLAFVASLPGVLVLVARWFARPRPADRPRRTARPVLSRVAFRQVRRDVEHLSDDGRHVAVRRAVVGDAGAQRECTTDVRIGQIHVAAPVDLGQDFRVDPVEIASTGRVAGTRADAGAGAGPAEADRAELDGGEPLDRIVGVDQVRQQPSLAQVR
jgi:uncharacterized membrane protein YbhN (UPF0104 family)